MKNLVAVVAVLAMFPILSYKEELFKKSFLYDSILKPLKTATTATKRQHSTPQGMKNTAAGNNQN